MNLSYALVFVALTQLGADTAKAGDRMQLEPVAVRLELQSRWTLIINGDGRASLIQGSMPSDGVSVMLDVAEANKLIETVLERVAEHDRSDGQRVIVTCVAKNKELALSMATSMNDKVLVREMITRILEKAADHESAPRVAAALREHPPLESERKE